MWLERIGCSIGVGAAAAPGDIGPAHEPARHRRFALTAITVSAAM
ncbi:hypothetical protein BTZ20_0896 [Rhodococcus sp. MTM3W5.2]|nr:hypothetical protein BTZ20_0896 [Rhodococcus sp. MTM3W5.2]